MSSGLWSGSTGLWNGNTGLWSGNTGLWSGASGLLDGDGAPPAKRIILTGNTVSESAPNDTAIGTLSVINGTAAGPITIVSQVPAGKTAIVSNVLRTVGTMDYETNPALVVTVTDSVTTNAVVVAVVNVLEVTLGALTLSSTTWTNSVPASGTIIGASAVAPLSTITAAGLPSGLTIDGAARTWAWSGSGSVSTPSFTLTETHVDGNNSPRVSTINGSIVNLPLPVFSVQPSISPSSGLVGATFTGTDGTASNTTGYTRRWLLDGVATGITTPTYVSTALGTLVLEVTATGAGGSTITNSPAATVVAEVIVDVPEPGPDLTPQADATLYPPMPFLTTKPNHVVGSKLRVQAAASYANLIAGTSLTIDSASFTLTADATTNQNGLRTVLAGISSGTTYFRVRVEPVSGDPTGWSNGILHGTNAVPTISEAGPFATISSFQLAQAITLSGPSTIIISGDDMARVNLSGTQGGTSYTLIWANDGVEYYSPVNDFDRNHVYAITFDVTGWNGKTASYARTIAISDYDITATTPSFAPVTNAALSTQQTSNPITVSGLDPTFTGTNGTIAAGLSYSKNGGAYVTTSPFSYTNGDTFTLRQTSSASYSTATYLSFALGAVSTIWQVTTLADPDGVVLTFAPMVQQDAIGAATTVVTVPLKAGRNSLAFLTNNSGINVSSASVAGIGAMTLQAENIHLYISMSFWTIVAPSDGNYSVTVNSAGGAFTGLFTFPIATTNAKATPTEAPYRTGQYYEPPVSMVAAGGVPAAGAFIGLWISDGTQTWVAGTEAVTSGGLTIGYRGLSGPLTIAAASNVFNMGLGVVLEKN